MSRSQLVFCISILMSLNLFAQTSELNLAPKHGGVLKITKNAALEIVKNKNNTDIYVTRLKNPGSANEKLSLSAIARVGNKEIPINLTYETDHYTVIPVNNFLHKDKDAVLMLTISFPGFSEKTSLNLNK